MLPSDSAGHSILQYHSEILRVCIRPRYMMLPLSRIKLRVQWIWICTISKAPMVIETHTFSCIPIAAAYQPCRGPLRSGMTKWPNGIAGLPCIRTWSFHVLNLVASSWRQRDQLVVLSGDNRGLGVAEGPAGNNRRNFTSSQYLRLVQTGGSSPSTTVGLGPSERAPAV